MDNGQSTSFLGTLGKIIFFYYLINNFLRDASDARNLYAIDINCPNQWQIEILNHPVLAPWAPFGKNDFFRVLKNEGNNN